MSTFGWLDIVVVVVLGDVAEVVVVVVLSGDDVVVGVGIDFVEDVSVASVVVEI